MSVVSTSSCPQADNEDPELQLGVDIIFHFLFNFNDKITVVRGVVKFSLQCRNIHT